MKMIMIAAAAVLALTAVAHAVGPNRYISGYTNTGSGKTVYSP